MTRPRRERNSTTAGQTPAAELSSERETKSAKIDNVLGSSTFAIPFNDKEILCEHHGDPDATPQLLFTHGAGGSLDTPSMKSFAKGFAATGISVACFQGSMNLKNRAQRFKQVIEHTRKDFKDSIPLALGGNSMGARAAVLAAQDSDDTTSLILVSYPLKNDKGDVRDQILLDLREDCDVLFVTGDHDSMCDLRELNSVREKMKARTWLVTVVGAGHGISAKPKSAVEPLRKATGRVASQWLHDRSTVNDGTTLIWNTEDETVVVRDDLSRPGEEAKTDKRSAKSSSEAPDSKRAKKRKSTG